MYPLFSILFFTFCPCPLLLLAPLPLLPRACRIPGWWTTAVPTCGPKGPFLPPPIKELRAPRKAPSSSPHTSGLAGAPPSPLGTTPGQPKRTFFRGIAPIQLGSEHLLRVVCTVVVSTEECSVHSRGPQAPHFSLSVTLTLRAETQLDAYLLAAAPAGRDESKLRAALGGQEAGSHTVPTVLGPRPTVLRASRGQMGAMAAVQVSLPCSRLPSAPSSTRLPRRRALPQLRRRHRRRWEPRLWRRRTRRCGHASRH